MKSLKNLIRIPIVLAMVFYLLIKGLWHVLPVLFRAVWELITKFPALLKARRVFRNQDLYNVARNAERIDRIRNPKKYALPDSSLPARH